MKRFSSIALAVLAASVSLYGQATFPRFASISSDGLTRLNRYNLGYTFEVGISSVASRGLSFSPHLTYNSQIFQNNGGVWSPVVDMSGGPTWGWKQNVYQRNQELPLFNRTRARCVADDGSNQWSYVYDNFRTARTSFNYYSVQVAEAPGQYPECGDPSPALSAYGQDSSGLPNGFLLELGTSSFDLGALQIFESAGSQIDSSNIAHDTNGNSIVASGSTWYDTIGRPAVTVTSNLTAHTSTYSYFDATHGTQNVVTSMTSKNIYTYFNCSGVSEYAATGVYLPTQILLGDGSSYTFDYELSTAPGHTSDTTGRISKITLPTGGYIQYTYGTTNCADGSPLQVTKTVNDLTNNAVWTYTRTTSSGIWTTTEHTPLNTDVEWVFNTGGIPTAEKVYQASVGGTILSETDTTYGSDGPSRTTLITGAMSRSTDYSYDPYGNMNGQYEYDWGSTTSPIRTTLYTYVNASAYINANLLSLPATQTIIQSGTTASYTEYFYDGKLTSGSTDTSAIAMVNQSGAIAHDDSNYGVSSTTPRGNLTRMVQYASPSGTPSGGLTTLYGYDSLGNLVKTVDPKGNITTISYADSWNSGSSSCSVGSGSGAYAHATSVTLGNGSSAALTTTATYNKCIGAVMSVVDPNSQTTTFGYNDPLLRLKSITTPDASTTPTIQYGYNHYASGSVANANVVTQILHAGSSTMSSTALQDGLGRTLKVQGTNLAYTQYAYGYDTTAHQSYQQVSNPYVSSSPSYWTKTLSDPLGRSVGVTYQDGSQATTSYTDNCWTMMDPASHSRKLCGDALGRLYQVFEDPTGLNYQTTYVYDGLNNLVSATQAGGPVRSFTYDGLSRLITDHPAEAGTTTYSYLLSGTPCSGAVANPCTKVDANSTTTTFAYDTLNRLTGKSYSGSTVGTSTAAINYYYDQTSYNGLTISNGKGQRTGMSDASGQTAWSFDVTGRPAYIQKTISGSTKTAQYTYNIDGTTDNLHYFSGSNVTYSYNSAGQPTSAIDTASSFNFATGATYTEAGQLQGLVQGYTSSFAGITTSNAYNSRLQPSVLSASKPSATLFSLSYGYGLTAGTNNGNVRVITNNLDSTRSQTYDYDALNRIATAQAGSSWGNTYVYDAFGNLKQKNAISGVSGESLSVNVSTSSNQITGVSGLAYDSGTGVMTDDNLGNHWSYDAENRVVSVGGSSYLYDGDGNRVMKSGTNARMYWHDPNGSVLNESDTSGNILVRNVYLNGTLVARREWNGNIHYPSVDHLGSARVVVSAAGTVEDDLDYYPFGTQIVHSSSSGNLYQFTGDETDSESSTDHTTFRQLSPSLGRWLRPDPYNGSYNLSNPQSLNRYSYVMNNPLAMVDSSGQFCVSAFPYGNAEEPYIDPFINSAEDCGAAYGTWYDTDSTVTVTTDEPDPMDPSAGPGLGAVAINPSSPSNSTSGSTSATPAPNTCKGMNFGLSLGGAAEAGATPFPAAAAQSSIFDSIFYNPSTKSFSIGATATVGGAGPAPVGSKGLNGGVAGAYAGYGVGITFGNAGSAQSLLGASTTMSINGRWGPIGWGASVSWSKSGVFQVTVGPPVINEGAGGSFSVVRSTTVKAFGKGC